MMKTSRFAWFATILVLYAPTLAAAQAVDRLLARTDTFAMSFSGAAGEQHIAVSQTGSGVRYIRDWSIPSLNGMRFEETTFVEIDRPFTVTRVTRTRIIGGTVETRSLDYRDGRVEGRVITRRGADSSAAVVSRVVPDGTIDGSAFYPFTLARSWKLGEQSIYRLFDPVTGGVTEQTVTAVALEQRLVAGVSEQALRLFVTTTGVPVTIWITRTSPHRLIADSSASTLSERRNK